MKRIIQSINPIKKSSVIWVFALMLGMSCTSFNHHGKRMPDNTGSNKPLPVPPLPSNTINEPPTSDVQMESELARTYGIHIFKGGHSGSYDSQESIGLFGWGGSKKVVRHYDSRPGDGEYSNFLSRLLNACREVGLEKRYVPFRIEVKKEN